MQTINGYRVANDAQSYTPDVGAWRRAIGNWNFTDDGGTQKAYTIFTVTHDSSAGVNYDTILYRLDPAVVPTVDLLWQPDGPLYLFGGDALDVAWANVQGRTWGLHIVMEVMF